MEVTSKDHEDTRVSRRPLYDGWVFVAVTAVVLRLAAGTRSAPGVFLLLMLYDTGLFGAATSAGQLKLIFIPALTGAAQDFGWRPTTVALGVAPDGQAARTARLRPRPTRTSWRAPCAPPTSGCSPAPSLAAARPASV